MSPTPQGASQSAADTIAAFYRALREPRADRIDRRTESRGLERRMAGRAITAGVIARFTDHSDPALCGCGEHTGSNLGGVPAGAGGEAAPASNPHSRGGIVAALIH